MSDPPPARSGTSRRAAPDPRPVLFVTNHAPAFRVGAFARLHEREGVVFALVGGRLRHGGGGARRRRRSRSPCSARRSAAVLRLAASGRFRAVVAGLSGRVAPARGLRRRPRRRRAVRAVGDDLAPPAHARARALLPAAPPPLPPRGRDRDLRAARLGLRPGQGRARRRWWRRRRAWTARSGPQPAPARRHAPFQALFAGRLEAEKGVDALLAAWARVDDAGSALVVLGDGPLRERAVAAGAVVPAGPLAPAEVRAHYAGSDVVVVPSIPTRDFLEPWGLVVNEAFHRGIPVVATTAVGAVAGGLARHERTALVVAPGDPEALAAALRRLRDDPGLRARLGAAGARGGRRVLARCVGRRDAARARRAHRAAAARRRRRNGC